jgi:hypothetical protein
MKRTGSSGSCVGPAVMRTVSPSRSFEDFAEVDVRAQTCNYIGDLIGFGEPARSVHPAGQEAMVGFDDDVAALPEDIHVFLSGRMRPHVAVHGRGQDYRTGKCQIGSGQKIIRVAVGKTREQVRGGGRQHHYVVVLGHGDVLDGTGQRFFRARGGEQIRDDFAAGEGGEG